MGQLLTHNAFTFVEVQNVVRFLKNYAETHAILLPGCIPGYKRDDIQLLPTCTTNKVSFGHVVHSVIFITVQNHLHYTWACGIDIHPLRSRHRVSNSAHMP